MTKFPDKSQMPKNSWPEENVVYTPPPPPPRHVATVIYIRRLWLWLANSWYQCILILFHWSFVTVFEISLTFKSELIETRKLRKRKLIIIILFNKVAHTGFPLSFVDFAPVMTEQEGVFSSPKYERFEWVYFSYMNGSTKMCKISLLWCKIWGFSTWSFHKKKSITHLRYKTVFYELKSEIAIYTISFCKKIKCKL